MRVSEQVLSAGEEESSEWWEARLPTYPTRSVKCRPVCDVARSIRILKSNTGFNRVLKNQKGSNLRVGLSDAPDTVAAAAVRSSCGDTSLRFSKVSKVMRVRAKLGGNNQRVKATGESCLHVYYRGAYQPRLATQVQVSIGFSRVSIRLQ